MEKWQAMDLIKKIKNTEIAERYVDRHKAFDLAIKALEEIQQYREIGTVEECQAAIERKRIQKPKLYGDYEDGKLLCPNCENDLMDLVECGFNCCPYCGQAIDWRVFENL